MKILYIHHVAALHGATLSLFTTIKGLKEKGVEQSIVIPYNWRWEDDFRHKLDELQIPYYKALVVRSVIGKNTLREMSLIQRMRFYVGLYKNKIKSFFELSHIVNSYRPDIIHTNVGVVHEGLWVAKRFRKPHVFHLREYQERDFGWEIIPSRSIFRFLLKKSTVVTITDDIRLHFGLGEYQNAYTIYNGICSLNDVAMKLPKEKFFFCASRISPEKGLEDVIHSFSIFYKTHMDYQLIIAGTGSKEYVNKLKEYSKEILCDGAIHFIGQIDNVLDYMRKASALIVGSYNEGFGRMTAEAAFSGCLFIGRNTGGTKEIMKKIGGYAFEDSDTIVYLMDIISNLSTSEYEREATIIQKKAIRFFSIEDNVNQMFRLYTNLLKCTE